MARPFYPAGLAQRRELEYASRALPTIEINGSFYSLQTPQSYRRWHDDTPDDFVFSVKGGRYITHMRRLLDVRAPLANFFASGVAELRDKLGPFLWQLPPNFAFDRDASRSFSRCCRPTPTPRPRSPGATTRKLKTRARIAFAHPQRLRHALEVRHPSFVDPSFIALLRKYDVAFVVADTARKWLEFEDVTADFVYMRLHGGAELYRSRYTEPRARSLCAAHPVVVAAAASRQTRSASRRGPRPRPPHATSSAISTTRTRWRRPRDALRLAGRLARR